MVKVTLTLHTGAIEVEGDEVRLIPCTESAQDDGFKVRVQVWNGIIKDWDINVVDFEVR